MTIRVAAPALLFSILAATSAQADCKADIDTILQAMQTAPPYRMTLETDADGGASKMEATAILPDRIRMKGDGMEMILTPNGFWMGKDGKLQKSPPEAAEQMREMIKQGMNIGVKAVEAPECAGQASFEGGSYELYKYIANGDFMGIKSTSSVEMYVNSDGRPEWMVMDGEAMGIKSKTKQHITYDDSITITDPN
jgi:hypothetical protein